MDPRDKVAGHGTACHFPDVPASSLRAGASGLPPGLRMVAGDFVEVYGASPAEVGAWDAVVTCFFIDTSGATCSPISPPHCTALPFAE